MNDVQQIWRQGTSVSSARALSGSLGGKVVGGSGLSFSDVLTKQLTQTVASPGLNIASVTGQVPIPTAVSSIQTPGFEVSIRTSDWLEEKAIVPLGELLLVENAEIYAITGNQEADDLVGRVLAIREQRMKPVDAGIRAVANAQTALTALGYDVGAFGPYGNGVDGILGPVTSEALNQFQKDHGLTMTGTLSAQTAVLLEQIGSPALDAVSADWQTEMSKSPFEANAYEGTANPYWYVRFNVGPGDDPETMGDIDPVFKGRLAQLARDAGQLAEFGEGFRDLDRQAYFYERYLAGTGALAARPGQSKHNMGLAVDTDCAWLRAIEGDVPVSGQTLLRRYGLVKPMAAGVGTGHEPWHIEPIEVLNGHLKP